ncbi:MAG: ABC transporter ATP-binding protein [Armatimonadota bacterium]|nr:ABC transporter ATP-binding protein [Armatimonadota bacterium]
MKAPVQLEEVCKVFGRGGRQVVAVDNLSFEVLPGEILALLGPNGAGKTTTVKIICGLITPTRGRIFILGLDIAKRYREALGHVGAVLEGNRNIYWRLTVAENLEYFAHIRGKSGPGLRKRIARLLEMVQLSDRRNDTAQTLSRGMQQRLAIACALVGDPEILLLDEPTLGLDFESSEVIKGEIQRLAREEGKAILLTTHQMELAQVMADRVGVITRGRLAVLDRLERLRQLFAFGRYEIHIEGTLSAEARVDLQKWEVRIHENQGQTTLTFTIDDQSRLYRLIETLRPHPIISVRRQEPDLAEIYLKILQREALHGTVGRAQG